MELVFVFVLILINGLFSMSEMAIASARRTRLQTQADEGNLGARVALDLAESPNRFLSTVQLFITLISILQGVFGGQAFAGSVAAVIAETVPALARFSEAIGYAIVVGIIAYLSLVIGELVPKRLALQNAERIATLVSRPMTLLASIASPIVWFLSASTNLIIRLIGIKKSDEASVTEFEVMAMVEEGVSSGVFEEGEQDMVAAVFKLDDLRIGSLITPRTDMVWINLEDSRAQIIEKITHAKYSSYPVGRGNVDNIVGIVQAKDLLAQVLEESQLNIEAIMTAPVFMPESVAVSSAIQTFKKEGVHTVMVVSEYGGIEGLVRMHDIIEQIFGNLEVQDTPDEADADENPPIRQLDGQYPLAKFAEHYPEFEMPADEDGKYETIAGFIMARLHKVPDVGDAFDFGALHFAVLAMDGVRIDQVRIERPITQKERDNEQS